MWIFPRVCVSVYHISWIYIPHWTCHPFCLGGTTRKGRRTPGQPPPNHQTIPTSSKTFHRSGFSTSSLDIGSWKFKSFRRGRWSLVLPGSGREGFCRSRSGGVLLFFFGGVNMVIMDPEKICLPVMPVSEVKVWCFGWYVFWAVQILKTPGVQNFRSLGDGWISKTPQNWWWIYGVVVVVSRFFSPQQQFFQGCFCTDSFSEWKMVNLIWLFRTSCCQTLLEGLSLLQSAKKKGRGPWKGWKEPKTLHSRSWNCWMSGWNNGIRDPVRVAVAGSNVAPFWNGWPWLDLKFCVCLGEALGLQKTHPDRWKTRLQVV